MLINTRIIAEPMNWVKIPLMAFTFFVGIYLFHKFVIGGVKTETK